MDAGLAGGLIGSALTAIVIRVIDLVQRKLEHSYSMKRTFFERKLHIAEAAVIERAIVSSALAGLSSVLGLIAKHPEIIKNPAPEFIKNMSDNISTQTAKLSASAFDAGKAAPLYFSLNEKGDPAAMNKMMEKMLAVNSKGMLFQFIVNQIQRVNDPAEKVRLETIATSILKELQQDAEHLSLSFEEGRGQLDSSIASIREEMKKYDS